MKKEAMEIIRTCYDVGCYEEDLFFDYWEI